MPRKPTAGTIRQMLDDVQFTVAGRFFESPDPTGGAFYIPLPTGSQCGVPFTELTANDQADLLHTHIRWEEYKAKGVTSAQVVGIWLNVQVGKPRDQWLDGTGLVAERNLTLEKLTALGQELAHDAALAKAETEQRRRVEKFGSIEQESAKLPARNRDRELER